MRQVKALNALMHSIEQKINDTATPCVMPVGEQDTREIERRNTIADLKAQLLQAGASYRAHLPIARDAELVISPRTPEEFRAMWGIKAQEAAEALIRALGGTSSGNPSPQVESIGDSSDGIAPCGYEEL